MSAYGQPLQPPRPNAPSAEFEVEDYSDANQAHAQWLRDSQAHKGLGGQAGGKGGGQQPQQQPQARRGTVPQRPAIGASGGTAAVRSGAVAVPGANRRPAPSFELPPTVEPVDRRAAPPRQFKQALGMPTPAAPPKPRRSMRPLEASDLEPISREAVQVWKALSRSFPGYFHAPELHDAAYGLLESILGSPSSAASGLSVEVRRKEDGAAQTHEIALPEVTIGSHALNTIQLAAAQISRRHARIVHDERGYCLVDQGSSNGTYLRGERVQPGYAYPLKNGESFTIPGHEILVRWQGGEVPTKLTGMRVSAVRVESARAFHDGLAGQGLVAMIRIEPAGLRMLLEIDLPLATLIVARVLARGGVTSPGETPDRPLSEVEKGVLELVAVKLLDAVQRRWAERGEWTLHLERLLEASDPAVRSAAERGYMVVTTVALDFDSRRDHVRLALPDPAIAALAPRLDQPAPRAGEAITEVFQRLKDIIGFAKVPVAAVAGRSRLSRAELASLTVGDIIVPDELLLRSAPEGLAGHVDLVFGERRGEVRGRADMIGWDGVNYQVRITEFIKGDGRREAGVSGSEPEMELEQQAAGEGAGADGAAEPEGGQILEDVPLPLVVELGRLQMTVRDIAGLRRGQVLELGRSPTEPVALVVEGRMIGAGKLVNVEGELGVQITNLQK